MDVVTSLEEDARACRNIGAPLTFLCHQGRLFLWSQTDRGPYQIGAPVPANRLDGFFREHRDDFAPKTIYRAKTLGRFQDACQRNFVDLGLMPLLEQEVGHAIERLLLDNVVEIRDALGWSKDVSLEQGRWLLKSVFWLLGAKMLHDKNVEGFIRLDFGTVDEVFARLATHYGESAEGLATSQIKRRALEAAAKRIVSSPSLQLATTEALAYVYENTLISKEVRAEFGTHSTPSYLVDYIVGRLAPWIEQIDQDKRSVFEPACGHSAFLVAAIRHLTSLLPAKMAEPAARKEYLRKRVRGYDADDFAVEIARLSLTLADIPNPNGWMVKSADLFESDLLEKAAKESTILLANPPFEDFKAAQRNYYARKFQTPQFINKTAEMLHRAFSAMPTGGLFGVIVPQNLLHSRDAADFRKLLVAGFEFEEICLFPDKVFNFADQESAVLLGRKRSASSRHRANHPHIAESGSAKWPVSSVRTPPRAMSWFNKTAFKPLEQWDLRVPELEACLDYVFITCLSFTSSQKLGMDSLILGKSIPNFPRVRQWCRTGSSPERSGDLSDSAAVFKRTAYLGEMDSEDPDVIFRPRSGTDGKC